MHRRVYSPSLLHEFNLEIHNVAMHGFTEVLPFSETSVCLEDYNLRFF